ncbi:MAG: hypothetical protein IPF88_13485 [Candidatus Microthrix sp.]|nr:hypothetical protein [Candidatus Microthrix sp.]MBK6439567.1 hypothetical protein [Candidatus Microthrix sp.]
MARQTGTYPVELGFLPDAFAIPDVDHPGLLRAGERASAPYGNESVEFHECPATDCDQDGDIGTDLLGAGFDTVDLTPFAALQSVLGRVDEAGNMNDSDAEAVQAALEGAVLQCRSGLTLTVLYVADEGQFIRTAGPNRMSMVPPRSIGRNDHGPATSVHGDQDVFGTPIRQLMDGEAPTLFRHDSPGVHNDEPSLMLVNLWIPLQQITQPLVLADGRSIDRKSHQLRYGLATDSFLEREDDAAINDIWMFLHDPDQRWFFRSEMDHRSAYVFNTLSTPHGAGVLPGENLAERCFRALEAGESAAERGDADGLVDALADIDETRAPDEATPALRRAIEGMLALADEARSDPEAVCGPRSQDWVASSQAARRSVVRRSLELRVVVSVDR